MTIYAYLRVSTETQTTARQEAASWLSAIPSACVYVDKASGKDMDRPAWQELMSLIKEGDEIHAHELSRVGRSLADLAALADDLMGRGITLVIHKEGIRLEQGNITSKLIFGILGSIAAWERETIKSRQKEGIEAIKADPIARAEKYKGRPRNQVLWDAVTADNGRTKAPELATRLGVSAKHIYGIRKSMANEVG